MFVFKYLINLIEACCKELVFLTFYSVIKGVSKNKYNAREGKRRGDVRLS